jgi:hypothetical protein
MELAEVFSLRKEILILMNVGFLVYLLIFNAI